MIRIAAVLLLLAGAFGAEQAVADDAATTSAHDFTFDMPYGDPLALKDFSGKAVLIVNTATECGFSGQLAGLQQLHETYAGRGLVVLGVPSNDFGGQEPRQDGDIAKFCEAKYGATFPLVAKTSVRGKAAHPFYRWAADTLGTAARPYWNFHKYLIGPDGRIEAWFATSTSPTSKKVTGAIEQILDGLPGS
ncbi:glutathione peroxidase [Roseibium sp. Sym1]|uniref:glutathione peroxidase n=1 Tax=Roseibium sp. Sym1 TaxID=3016006 RepID=UPI0022B57690|nr:glutathione peroxidase [Roseibium sp. Sym1]